MSRFRNALGRLHNADMDDQMRIAYDYALALDAEIGAIEPGLIVAGNKDPGGHIEWVRLNARLDRYIAVLSGNPALLRAMDGSNLDVNDMLDRPAGQI